MDSSKWQPIETAPNGESVLLHCRNSEIDFVLTGYRVDVTGMWFVTLFHNHINAEILYWQPLPELMK